MKDSVKGLIELISKLGQRRDASGTSISIWTLHREKHSKTIDISQINKCVNKWIHMMLAPSQLQWRS